MLPRPAVDVGDRESLGHVLSIRFALRIARIAHSCGDLSRIAERFDACRVLAFARQELRIAAFLLDVPREHTLDRQLASAVLPLPTSLVERGGVGVSEVDLRPLAVLLQVVLASDGIQPARCDTA
jgi:hypothetical protein